MTKKAKKDDGYRTGKFTGYHIRDGAFYIAPTHVSTMEDLLFQDAGLRTFSETVNRFMEKRWEEIHKASRHYWEHLAEDLGLQLEGHNWVYDSNRKCIFDAPKPEPEKDA